MRLSAAALAAALALLPAPSRPEAPGGAPPKTGAAAKPPPAAASDLARALLTAEQWAKVLDGYASSLASQIAQALQAKGEKAPDDLHGKLRAELERTLPYQQTVQAQAEALSRELTPDELRKTATFYGSPLGRKVLDKLPDAQSQVAQQLQGTLATAVPEIVNRLAPSAMPGSSAGGAGGTGSSAEPGGPERRDAPAPGRATTR